MYGNLIQEFFTSAGSWTIGAALSVIMLVVTVVLVIVFLRLVDVRRVVA
jgi:ABC-type spermidine/putrescine transport system permease subunit I